MGTTVEAHRTLNPGSPGFAPTRQVQGRTAVSKPTDLAIRGSVITAVALFTLTGCASGGGAGSAVDGPSAQPSEASDELMSEEEWAEVVDAANEEGEVTVYGVMNPTYIELMPAAFQEEYPDITVTYVRLGPADLTARLDAEVAAGNAGADAIDNLDHPTFDAYADRGVLMPLAVPALGDPEYDRATFQRTPYVATASDAAYAWAWNSDLLPEGISSWDDFLDIDTELVGVTDPSIGPTVTSLYQMIETPEQAGPEYLDKLMAAGKPKIYPGSNPQVAALAAGEVSASLPVPAAVVALQKAAGAPVDYRLPADSPSIPNEIAVVKSAKNPNAALVYTNWVLSEAGQEVQAESGFLAVRDGITQIVDVDGAALSEIPQITSDEFQAFVQRWNQLLAQ